MNPNLTFTREFRVERSGRGRRRFRDPRLTPDVPRGTIPRVTKLMALALRFDQLIRDGLVADQAELARLGHVSRPRVTQIMNFLNLAPDIQEELLFLPRTERGCDPISEHDVRPIAGTMDWRKQRRMLSALIGKQLARVDTIPLQD
ncbi:MAG: hypothetical protein WD066_08430 [Planctomycetaceae bacterium]